MKKKGKKVKKDKLVYIDAITPKKFLELVKKNPE